MPFISVPRYLYICASALDLFASVLHSNQTLRASEHSPLQLPIISLAIHGMLWCSCHNNHGTSPSKSQDVLLGYNAKAIHVSYAFSAYLKKCMERIVKAELKQGRLSKWHVKIPLKHLSWPSLDPKAVGIKEWSACCFPLSLLHAAGSKVGHGGSGFVYIELVLCHRSRLSKGFVRWPREEKFIAKAVVHAKKDSGVVEVDMWFW